MSGFSFSEKKFFTLRLLFFSFQSRLFFFLFSLFSSLLSSSDPHLLYQSVLNVVRLIFVNFTLNISAYIAAFRWMEYWVVFTVFIITYWLFTLQVYIPPLFIDLAYEFVRVILLLSFLLLFSSLYRSEIYT
ncbi:hypothetical protein BDV19DRAFT_184147 [Aspergillus venezuelensis]